MDVALVGASERSAWSHMIMRRFRDFGHQGRVYAVNREGKPAHGLPGYRSCCEIPETPGTAIIFVPAQAVAGVLEEVADAGIPSAVVLSSGFAEAGAEGQKLQDELVEIAERRGVTLFGPNSLGFANIVGGAVATAIGTRIPVLEGAIGVVSQSGAVANEIGKFAHQQGIGLSFICATGNEAMVTPADVIDYLVDDPATRVITAYIEAVSATDCLAAAARRALASAKPIIVLKVGSSSISADVAKAHTGAMVGDDRVFDAACLKWGIIRVRSIEEMMVTAALIEAAGPLERQGIALASVSGGGCGMFADLAEQHGVPIPAFAPQTCTKLAAALPSFASTLNPLDMTGVVLQAPSLWTKILPILFDDPGIGLVVTLIAMPGTEAEMPTCQTHWPVIAQAYSNAGKRPMLLSQVIQPMGREAREVAEASGLRDIIFGMDFGTRALGHLASWSRRLGKGNVPRQDVQVLDIPPRLAGERAALDFLASRGVPAIPGIVVQNAEEALRAADTFDSSVVLKIASPDIAHKSEIGGVRLDVAPCDAGQVHDEIRRTVSRVLPGARIEGIIASPMRQGGIELFVGVARDPDWGLAIVVGLGGVWVEILKDTAVRLLPVDKTDACEMLSSLRGAALLEGYRGTLPADLDRLTEVIVSVGDAALALGPRLAALEINPLWVHGDTIEALVVWRE
ncbi:acetate--CoA ligase family protein [Novosphingobium sp. G106]|uniref:acetate--CoA ligase family protein n=1 Tax=Novosphingobium sp. G106 TaxID=2849500 RepID=UPI001C2D9525|nr:acetate--CoA ligase family protein [Novosphingobium sp. G106]MBV1687896.1 acetate--CoA ligase family protein [Novosphingobium sp. G106]